jgi:hypothetical protein
MFDELERLCSEASLRNLLRHYVVAGDADREAWHTRVSELPGVSAATLVKLHGELIAHQWIEQNTGVISMTAACNVAGCYRGTAAGRKALRRAEMCEVDQRDPAGV